MIRPEDIVDPNVRKWFINKLNRRSWIIVVLPAHIGGISPHFNFVYDNIPRESDKVVILLVDCDENKANDVEKINVRNHKIIHYEDSEHFAKILDIEHINSFYSHASFHREILEMRKILLSDRFFPQVLSIWCEGGFLRNVTYQYDWLGWNAWSSLAKLNINRIPDLTKEQNDFVHYFITEKFLERKLRVNAGQPKMKNGELRFRRNPHCLIESKEQLGDICETSKPICLVALQVLTDSTITQFAPEQYRDRKWAFLLAETHKDVFFVIKDHPKQVLFNDVPNDYSGANWLYLPYDSEYDTQTMAMHSDIVTTVNSTVGSEALYWTPVVAAGDTVYTHDQICYHIDDFSSEIVSKRRADIHKFLYYAITRFHFTPLLVESRSEWFDILDDYRKEAGVGLERISIPAFDSNWMDSYTMP